MRLYTVYIWETDTLCSMHRLILNNWMYKWKGLLHKLWQETSGIIMPQLFSLLDVSERNSAQVYSTVCTDA